MSVDTSHNKYISLTQKFRNLGNLENLGNIIPSFLISKFSILPYSQIENSDFKISEKNFRVFRVFDLAKFFLCNVEIMNNVSSEDDYAFSSQPQKKKRKIYCDCIIPCSDTTDKLVLPESLESWNVILRAVEIRNHKAVLDLAKDIGSSTVPDIE